MKWETFQKNLLGKFTPEGILQLCLAFSISFAAHKGQLRDDGSPYFEHIIRCVLIAIYCGERDVHVIVLLLLHDTVEETKDHAEPFTLQMIEQKLDAATACRVSWLTKHDHTEKGRHHYWILLHQCKDAKTIKAKVFDRIDNIETLSSMKGISRQKKKLAETLVHFRRFTRWLMSDVLVRNFPSETAREAEVALVRAMEARLRAALMVHGVDF